MSNVMTLFCPYNPITELLDTTVDVVLSEEETFPLVEPWLWIKCKATVEMVGNE